MLSSSVSTIFTRTLNTSAQLRKAVQSVTIIGGGSVYFLHFTFTHSDLFRLMGSGIAQVSRVVCFFKACHWSCNTSGQRSSKTQRHDRRSRWCYIEEGVKSHREVASTSRQKEARRRFDSMMDMSVFLSTWFVFWRVRRSSSTTSRLASKQPPI